MSPNLSLFASDRCHDLQSPNPLTVFLAAFIFIGIVVSYLPQHAKIITNGTSAGLSPWWVLLGGISSIAALGNIMTLPASRDDMRCCKVLTGGECAAALLGIAQIGLQWACFMFIVMLFLIYFPTASDEIDLTSSTASLTHSPLPKRRDQLIVGVATLLTVFVVGITSLALVAAYQTHTQNWANFLGTCAGILAMIQYMPQIWYTWRLGEIRSLSVLTMLIQVPGAFLFAFSLWLRVGWAGWSTWLMYVVTGILQAVLLGLAIAYWLADRKLVGQNASVDDGPEVSCADDVDGAADEDLDPTEQTALLRNRNGHARDWSSHPQRPAPGSRQLSMLYAATPPDQDSDPNSDGRG